MKVQHFLEKHSNLEMYLNSKKMLSFCDIIYCKYYMNTISVHKKKESIHSYLSLDNNDNFFDLDQNQIKPHLKAYFLGAIQLIYPEDSPQKKNVFSHLSFDLNVLIDKTTKLPRWPILWSQHVWRVSHWIGGIPAIMLSIARAKTNPDITEATVLETLQAIDDHIICDKTGLMKPYKSASLHWLFNNLYKLRHNPDFAEIGGVVHIHWVNYAMNRPYKAAEALYETAIKHLMSVDCFFEKVPYCLDFDYIQLIRTILAQQNAAPDTKLKQRCEKFCKDIDTFLEDIPTGYTLHKLAGALATRHELALLLNQDTVPFSKAPPVDIIKRAYWI